MPFLEDGGDAQAYATMSGTLDARLLKALSVMGFETMTPVQQIVLTQMPNFQSDCLVQAKTGTGKTAAFLLPCLHTLLNTPRPLPKGQVGVLIISPTRELALQIAKECDQLTSQLGKNRLECHVAFGGTARASNMSKFMNGSPSILVATPGRLKDYLSERPVASRFANIRTVILDEADTMLESGFLADVREILKLLPPKSAGWQGMCFSATVPAKTRDVIDCVLAPGYCSLSTIDKTEPPTLERVPQYHVIMPSVVDTFNTLSSLINHELAPDSKAIVFGVTANMVALYSSLFAQGLTSLRVFELHSRLSQNVRTRTTSEFKSATSGIMFASDVIGRGMDFPNVDLVIQVGLPSSAEQYVHRVGRTGRAGNTGRAIILLTQAESFFITANRRLPIQPHAQTAAIVNDAIACAPQIEQAMYAVDETVKQRAYSSFLGFFAGSGLLKPLRMDKAGLVRIANDMALQGMHCPEPPAMEKKTIGKMGLKGVPGFNYSSGGATTGAQATQPPRRPRVAAKEGSNGSHDVLSPKQGDTGAVKKKPFRNGRRGGNASAGREGW
ncbi:hypothetical protein LTR70_007835 [Exophiala xenobiotica]|uniref:ATP-dependent RNA helicase n=1 Tax=Lithohypha guttulata TaxID=1690604 RepID=A0ABR0K0D9_9EURO|nr:hypothetical protein LTR24_008553 [Lithohypha guttulata]KAK5312995.1 hypothetical protein LTR70_007835 [Exophiala xenobiotica]